MDSIPSKFAKRVGHHRWVIVPMWGFAAAVSAGYAGPGVGIDANVYLYMPFSFYEAFGHELSIGAALGAGPTPGMGGAADVIFGCCTSPLSTNGVPLDIVTKDWRAPKPLGFKVKYPVKPFVRIAVTGGHVAVQIASTPLEPYAVRLIQPSTGLEIKTQKNAHTGEYELLEDEDYNMLLQDEDKENEKGVEGSINIGYARACRHFTSKAKKCFSSFNP